MSSLALAGLAGAAFIARLILLVLDPLPLAPGDIALAKALASLGAVVLPASAEDALSAIVTHGSGVWPRLPGLLALTAAGWGLGRLGTRLYDARAGLLAALLFLTLPGVSLAAAQTTVASVLPLLWLLGVASLLHALQTDTLAGWLGLGVCLGVGLGLSPTTALFFPCLLLYALISPETYSLGRRRGVWLALAPGLILTAPGLAQLAPLAPTPGTALAFALSVALLLGPLTLVLALAPWSRHRTADDRRRQGYRARLLLAFSAPLLAGLVGLAALNQAPAPDLALPAGLGLALLIASALGPRARGRWIIAGVVLVHIGLGAWLLHGAAAGTLDPVRALGALSLPF
ncbi:glycosyltransferase family 39 protein [Pararhodospirillum photometricum]|uniref:4-amino-4-deoxy-L-arabinose transferase and related glycosyltransferases of PMT family-like n=1 Tax=Pararhodospirillum photometricum DSM 122 TaxID=1150469 RepID=H6SMI0_PARPM|nr:glycosyltransferase family 39 protein [Pararhodospirillum photometricum]CCG09115.1 4-amino-4-deoxy-L-arabinose transferase and related glycosyltransferases of PMT family-like [Pararhodospirillum photometricum DSM 122]